MTTPTLPREIAAVMEEAPWIINEIFDEPHPMDRYHVVLKDDPTCFGEPCSHNQARAEANRLNDEHVKTRLVELIEGREKALVDGHRLIIQEWVKDTPADDDDYEEGYEAGLKTAHDLAQAALEQLGVR